MLRSNGEALCRGRLCKDRRLEGHQRLCFCMPQVEPREALYPGSLSRYTKGLRLSSCSVDGAFLSSTVWYSSSRSRSQSPCTSPAKQGLNRRSPLVYFPDFSLSHVIIFCCIRCPTKAQKLLCMHRPFLYHNAPSIPLPQQMHLKVTHPKENERIAAVDFK
jgi:hypothetical protein